MVAIAIVSMMEGVHSDNTHHNAGGPETIALTVMIARNLLNWVNN